MKQKADQDEKAQLNQLSKEELVQLVIETRKKLKELEERIAQLSISLKLDSQNSSKPPSTDLLKKSEKPASTPESEKKQAKRKPGGQPGHQGSTRKGFDRIDRISINTPQLCHQCGQSLESSEVVKTEKQQELLWELGEIEVGIGTLVTTNQRVETAIAPSVEQLQTWIETTQPDIHVDETPWTVKGVKEWLWVFGNQQFCLFRAADTRSRAELEAQLGKSYDGILSSDDLSVYNGYQVTAQQKCLAHLRRHFKKLQLQPGLHNQQIADIFIRHLRLAVTKRKISGGSRSMERFEQTARLLSVVQTCRRQGRSVITFFAQALKATLGLTTVPSLIPLSPT